MINRINNESNARVTAKKKTREKFGAASEATENPLQNLPFIGGLFQSDANKAVTNEIFKEVADIAKNKGIDLNVYIFKNIILFFI